MKGKTAKMAYVWSKEKPEGRGEAGQWKRQLKKPPAARGEGACMKNGRLGFCTSDNEAFPDKKDKRLSVPGPAVPRYQGKWRGQAVLVLIPGGGP